ncbi:hypothetical protein B0H16DRAFT_97448 [Mycena metata]|uniref:Uncharacterized protein n=1 Tax=Mycena metata TaxID=1033252 RepID=A0AAD7IBU6_9AGAR|nr:hypothetical protein B0H16DRAFT_97448 [Mycena metata]
MSFFPCLGFGARSKDLSPRARERSQFNSTFQHVGVRGIKLGNRSTKKKKSAYGAEGFRFRVSRRDVLVHEKRMVEAGTTANEIRDNRFRDNSRPSLCRVCDTSNLSVPQFWGISTDSRIAQEIRSQVERDYDLISHDAMTRDFPGELLHNGPVSCLYDLRTTLLFKPQINLRGHQLARTHSPAGCYPIHPNTTRRDGLAANHPPHDDRPPIRARTRPHPKAFSPPAPRRCVFKYILAT